MGGAITIKDKKKGARVVKALTKPQSRAKVDAEVGVEGAHVKLELLEAEVKKLKKKVAGHEKTIGLLWKWKLEQEIKR